jgi:hypothetical protein
MFWQRFPIVAANDSLVEPFDRFLPWNADYRIREAPAAGGFGGEPNAARAQVSALENGISRGARRREPGKRVFRVFREPTEAPAHRQVDVSTRSHV